MPRNELLSVLYLVNLTYLANTSIRAYKFKDVLYLVNLTYLANLYPLCKSRHIVLYLVNLTYLANRTIVRQ